MATTTTLPAKTVTVKQQAVGAVKGLRTQIQAFSKGLDSQQALDLTGRAIGTLQDEINHLQNDIKQIAKLLNSISSSSSSTTTSGSISIQEVAAPNGTTTNITASVAPVADSILCVFVTQDSTGGGLITFSSDFKWAVTNIDTTAGTVTCFTFVGRTVSSTTSWYMSTLPLTGQF